MKIEIDYIRVGTTRSGKVIPYVSSVNGIKDVLQYFKRTEFSSDDLLDAFSVFNYLAVREIRRFDDAIFYLYVEEIGGAFAPEELSGAKERANINSAFELRDLGKSLIAVEFNDF